MTNDRCGHEAAAAWAAHCTEADCYNSIEKCVNHNVL